MTTGRWKRDRDGFTLVELMVGIALGAIAMAVLVSIFIGTQSMYYETRDMVGDANDARVILSMITHEIRSAGSDPQNVNIERFAKATPDTLRLQSDLDGDTMLEFTEPPEDVTYIFDSSARTLTRNTGMGAVVLLNGLDYLGFSYLDSAGDPVGGTALTPEERAQVASVRVDMMFARADGGYTNVEGTVSVRNR